MRDVTKKYLEASDQLRKRKKIQKELQALEAEKLKASPTDTAINSRSIDLKAALHEIDEFEKMLLEDDILNTTITGNPTVVQSDPLPKYTYSYPVWNTPADLGATITTGSIGSGTYQQSNDSITPTTNTGNPSGFYGTRFSSGIELHPYRPSRESEIIKKYTESMAKSKLSKKLYDLVMQFELAPSKQGLHAVLEYLEYPEPWPAFDSIKNITIVNDKFVIETYDSESQVDRDLFDSANGFGHGIQSPRHKKSESTFDKFVKSKGGEVGVQPRRTFQSGRTLRLSD